MFNLLWIGAFLLFYYSVILLLFFFFFLVCIILGIILGFSLSGFVHSISVLCISVSSSWQKPCGILYILFFISYICLHLFGKMIWRSLAFVIVQFISVLTNLCMFERILKIRSPKY